MGNAAIIKQINAFQPKGVTRTGTNGDYTPGGNFNIFNVGAAGPVLLYAMWGHVRVACTGAALVPLIVHTPTVGAAGTAICTVCVGAAHALGVVLTWSGLLAGVLAPTAAVGHGQAGVVESFDGGPIILMPGIMSITNATADATAEIDWYVSYKPLASGANMTVL